jgi:tetratricopeptide (TPR) repeat protein
MSSKKPAQDSLKLTTSNRKLIPMIKKKLREKVPPLSSNELRRIRMELHEALLLELKEGPDIEAFNFFNEIIERDLSESRTIVNNKDLLEMIFDELKKSDCKKEERLEGFLSLGSRIRKFETTIQWLEEMIYVEALKMIQNFDLNGSRVDAVGKFQYGRFLNNQQKYKLAVKILEESLKICEFEKDWIEEELNLRVLVANELFQSMRELSKEVRNQNPKNSLEICMNTSKLVKNFEISDKLEKEVTCEMELGNCYEALTDFDKARRHFEHAYELSVFDDPQNELNALLKMADCYKNNNNVQKYEELLNRALIHAKSGKTTKTANGEILVKLGRFLIGKGDNVKALECFEKAASIYEKAKDSARLYEVQMLMAFPKGEKIQTS